MGISNIIATVMALALSAVQPAAGNLVIGEVGKLVIEEPAYRLKITKFLQLTHLPTYPITNSSQVPAPQPPNAQRRKPKLPTHFRQPSRSCKNSSTIWLKLSFRR